MNKDVFISHSSADNKEAIKICDYLEGNKIECFIAPRDIRVGNKYAEELIDGIDNAKAMVLLLSNESNNSPHVLREVERAVSRSIPIIIYKIEYVELSKSMEYFLMTHQWLESKKDSDLNELLQKVKNAIKEKQDEDFDIIERNLQKEMLKAGEEEKESMPLIEKVEKKEKRENPPLVDEIVKKEDYPRLIEESVRDDELEKDDKETKIVIELNKGKLLKIFSVAVLIIIAVIVAVIAMNGTDNKNSSRDESRVADNFESKNNGKNEEGVEVVEKENGKIIVIDAGHQKNGNNEQEPIGPGATETKAKVTTGTTGCSTGVAEYELNLQIALKLQAELENRGYTVIMIRTSNDVDISNSERAEIANNSNADAFIRVHANGSENQSLNGVLTMCQTPDNTYNGDLYKECRELSENVLNEIVAATGCNKLHVLETDTMSGINWCQTPVTIVEVGYITNPTEEAKLITDEYQYKVVNGIANGIDKTLYE